MTEDQAVKVAEAMNPTAVVELVDGEVAITFADGSKSYCDPSTGFETRREEADV